MYIDLFKDLLEKSEKNNNVDEIAYITVVLYEHQETVRKAMYHARKKFLKLSGCRPKAIKGLELKNKKKIELFTSLSYEYVFKILADPEAINNYYLNKPKNKE